MSLWQVTDEDFLGSANIFFETATGESGTDFDICTPAHLYTVRLASIDQIAAGDGNVDWRKFSIQDLVKEPGLAPYVRFGSLLSLDRFGQNVIFFFKP